MATDPYPQNHPWERAKKRYLELCPLAGEERKIFEEATPENIFYSASSAEKLHQEDSKSRYAANKLQPIVAAITQYGEALDVGSNAFPLVLSPVWGGIRVLLLIASGFGKYFEKLIEMFERIGDVLPRFNRYQSLFQNHPHLQESLAKVYLDIIEFCIRARQFFWDAKKNRTRSGLRALKTIWKPFEHSFGDILTQFRRHRENIEQDANLCHMIDMSEEMRAQGQERQAQALERRIAQQERSMQVVNTKVQKHKKLLRRLTKYDYDERHKLLSASRKEGTGVWILHSSEFKDWEEGTISSCLWCWGIPGAGKTTLITGIVEYLRRKQVYGPNYSLGYYYCDYKEPKLLKSREVLGSFIYQLLKDFDPLPEELGDALEALFDEESSPSSTDLLGLLQSVIKHKKTAFLVVDGIDELEEQERKELLSYLETTMDLNIGLKLIVSSRKDVDIDGVLHRHPTIALSSLNMSSDIQLFTRDKLRQLADRGTLPVTDTAMLQDIEDELVKGADGLFLWVKLQLADMSEATTEEEVKELVKNLPIGLNATYSRALKKVVSRGKRQSSLASRAFSWLISARRTLSLTELLDAVAIAPLQKAFDNTKRPIAKQLLRACGNLIVEDERQDIYLAHYTVREFLLSISEENGLPEFQFSEKVANIMAGELCVTYLSFRDFDAQIQQRPLTFSLPQRLALERPADAFFSHHVGFNKTVNSVWNIAKNRWFSGVAKPPIDLDNYLRLARMAPPPLALSKQFPFLVYARQYWIEHTTDLSFDASIWPLFEDLVLHRVTAFEFRFWERLSASELLDCAVARKHRALLRVALSNSLPQELLSFRDRKWDDRDTLLTSAIKALDTTAITYLIGQDGDPSLSLTQEQCVAAMHSAAMTRGGEQMMSIILERNSPHEKCIEAKDYQDRTPLHTALLSENFPAFTWLIRMGACLDAVDVNGITPMHLIAEKEHRYIDFVPPYVWNTNLYSCTSAGLPLHHAVRFGNDRKTFGILLEHTQNRGITVQDQEGFTVVHLAVQRGYIEYVKQLISKFGATSCATRSHSGSTPLHQAIMTDNWEIFLFLLKNGPKYLCDYTDIRGRTPLYMAVALRRQLRYLETLLREYKTNACISDISGQHPIHLAIEERNLTIVECLVKNGVNINSVRLVGGVAPLFYALDNNATELMQFLLTLGVDTEIRDHTGQTVLSKALFNLDEKIYHTYDSKSGLIQSLNDFETSVVPYEHMAMILLQNGADPGVVDPSGECLLSRTILARCSPLVVKLLLDHGVDVNATNSRGETPLMHATTISIDGELLDLLLERGASPNIPDYNNETPLFRAKSWLVVQILLEHGASTSIDIRSKDGDTVLSRVFSSKIYPNHKARICELLIDAGASVVFDMVDNNRDTILFHAIRYKNTKLIQKLIKLGANVNMINHLGETPLSLAIDMRDIQCVQILVEGDAEYDNNTMLHLLKQNLHLGYLFSLLGTCTEFGKEHSLLIIEDDYGYLVKFLKEKGFNTDAMHVYKDVSGESLYNHVNMWKENQIDLVRLLDAQGLTSTQPTVIECIRKNSVLVASLLDTFLIHTPEEPDIYVFSMICYLIRLGVEFPPKGLCLDLHNSAGQGYIINIQYQLGLGVDINTVNTYGETAVFCAARNNQMAAARVLIDRGANPNHIANDYRTALDYAADEGHIEMLRFLVESSDGTYKRWPKEFLNAPFHWAVRCDNYTVFNSLCSVFPMTDINLQDSKGDTVLHVAASSVPGHKYIGKLLSLGASLEIRNQAGKTAYNVLEYGTNSAYRARWSAVTVSQPPIHDVAVHRCNSPKGDGSNAEFSRWKNDVAKWGF